MSAPQHTPGPWWVDGPPHNQIVWAEGTDNRVCFMAHSDGADTARDVATARLIAAAPELLTRLERSSAIIRARFIGRGTVGGSCGLCHSTWQGEIEDHYEGCAIALNDILITKARWEGGA